ncbi:MAG: phosphoribosylamine--glycine ligase [Clostridiales bacterium]|jgi:phosphoribosylamine--glycine ligase|nr:phosphoribosylamine--glycine ligase [Clostridiales bacterium]
MNVLIIGGGGREHAIGWKIKRSPSLDKLFFAPGNAGTAEIGENIAIKTDDFAALAGFAKDNRIGVTIVGPEAPLQAGIVDYFKRNGLRVFGPSKAGAALEGSKSFAKTFMKKYDVPTANYKTFDSQSDALDALNSMQYPIVVKADGLAAGKGVIICASKSEAEKAIGAIMGDRAFGAAGDTIVIEEFLEGPEASVLCFTDGETLVPMESAGDYKRAFDHDKGLNTGGMGSVSPAFGYTPDMAREIADKTLKGLKAEGFDYRGIIYIGLKLTSDGPKVLEYNVRFGDPETQALLPRLDSDLLEIINAVTDGELNGANIKWKKEKAVSVVMASGGYPETFNAGYVIKGVPKNDVAVFHAGTALSEGKVVTNGGRVLAVTALGADMDSAREKAYEAVKKITFKDSHYRNDIGLDPEAIK